MRHGPALYRSHRGARVRGLTLERTSVGAGTWKTAQTRIRASIGQSPYAFMYIRSMPSPLVQGSPVRNIFSANAYTIAFTSCITYLLVTSSCLGFVCSSVTSPKRPLDPLEFLVQQRVTGSLFLQVSVVIAPCTPHCMLL